MTSILNFGPMALTSLFPNAAETAPLIDLNLMRCAECDLVQLDRDTDPNLMYRDGYGYKSGINETMVRHLDSIVAELAVHVKPGDRVLDIGCNDGTLLKSWQRRAPGVECFGIDPIGQEVAGASVTRGYFRAHERTYKVITSIAMLYDLPDPVEFAREVAASLEPDGVWAIEVGYAGAVLDGSWDGICHEHLEYYGLGQIRAIGAAAGFGILSHRFTATNGGSLFVVLVGKGAQGRADVGVIAAEARWDWSAFEAKVRASIAAIRAAVHSFDKVYALGASTKGNTLLQACGFTARDVRCAVERNPDKVGRCTPGSDIPIVAEQWARENPPDAFLVLPYHFKESLLAREAALRARGAKFIFPLPQVEIC